MTISGVISGNTGAILTKLGSSTLTLSANNNNLVGGFDVAEGTLKMGIASAYRGSTQVNPCHWHHQSSPFGSTR